MGGSKQGLENVRDKALHTVGMFGGKAASLAGGTAQRLEGLAASRIPQYKEVRGHFYQPGDFTSGSAEKPEMKATSEKHRDFRRQALSGEKGVANADILKTEAEELIQARLALQGKLLELEQSYPDKEGRAKNRAAVGGAATILWESVNWLRDWFPSSQKDCDGQPVQKTELSTWFTVLQSAALCYGSYKVFYEPVQQNFEKQQAQFNSWIDKYDTEIDAILEDLRGTGHEQLAGELVQTHGLAPEQHLIRSNSQ